MSKSPSIEINILGLVKIDGLVVMDLNDRFEDYHRAWDDLLAEERANMAVVRARWGDKKIDDVLAFIAPEIDAYIPPDNDLIVTIIKSFPGGGHA